MFVPFRLGKDERKRKGNSPIPTDKSQSAKKKSPEEKKATGFDRGLEPEKILGKSHVYMQNVEKEGGRTICCALETSFLTFCAHTWEPK